MNEAMAAFVVAIMPSAYLFSKNPEIIEMLGDLYKPYNNEEEKEFK